MIEIGPEVSGKPISQPLTPGPHLRPTRVASVIRQGGSATASELRSCDLESLEKLGYDTSEQAGKQRTEKD
jgi:hypothetical protein